MFDETISPNLFKYILAVGDKHGFAIERISVLPCFSLLLRRPNLKLPGPEVRGISAVVGRVT